MDNPENEGSIIFPNTGTYIAVYTASYPVRCKYEAYAQTHTALGVRINRKKGNYLMGRE